jgi:hypothetical protein
MDTDQEGKDKFNADYPGYWKDGGGRLYLDQLSGVNSSNEAKVNFLEWVLTKLEDEDRIIKLTEFLKKDWGRRQNADCLRSLPPNFND